MKRVPPRHAAAVRSTVASLLLLAGSALAAPPAPATGLDLAARAALTLQRSERGLAAAPGLGSTANEPLAPRASALSSARLVEMPAEIIPGQYARPKYALGFRSAAMKSLAKDLGLDAHTCLLPLVRARTTLSQDGAVGGRVMIFARCSFY